MPSPLPGAARFRMASAVLWPCSAERLFIISRLTRSAERVRRFFSQEGSEGKMAALPLPSCRFAAIHLPQGDGFSSKGKVCGSAKGVPLGELARRKPCLRGYTLKLPQSPTATDFPFCRCATSSPGRGKSSSEMGPLAWRQSFRRNRKVSGSARGSLPEGAGKPAGFD